MQKVTIIALSFLVFSASFGEVTKFGQKGLVRTFSAKTLNKGKLSVDLSGAYSADQGYIKRQFDTSATGTSSLITNTGDPLIISGDMGLTFGITNFFDLSFALPLYFDRLSGANISDQGGPGDVQIGGKFQYPPYSHPHIFEMAYLGYVSLPTGKANKGTFPRYSYYIPKEDSTKYSFYTTKRPSIDLKMLWTLDVGAIEGEYKERRQIQFHTNFGAKFNTNTDLEHAFLLSTAVEYSPAPFITIFTEFTGETRLSKFTNGFHIGDDPLRLTPGISINTPVGMTIKISGDVGLSKDSTITWARRDAAGNPTKGYETGIIPGWNVNGSIGWSGFLISRDKDNDGIKDNDDKCPNEPEDMDNFKDGDGCPDTDNDGDGIPDLKDKCPSKPEELDGFDDEDGCPDPDNDKDGIPDQKDRCPRQAEDLDGFEDYDGCLDPDNDKDGIPDSLDKCRNDIEDKDGFEDKDGCPDLDNDKDGIPDLKDKCPKEAENMNGFQDTDGCPDKKITAKKINKKMVLKGVQFKTGSTELTFESRAVLDGILTSLRAYKKVRIEIRGYTDNVGKRSSNIRLSQRRADAVKRYFVMNGISSSRLVAVGFGPDNPIASNRTARGRSLNRRIEIYRLN